MYFYFERIQKIAKTIQELCYYDIRPVNDIVFLEGNNKGLEKLDIDISNWRKFLPEDRWGGKDKHCWFRMNVKIPSEFEGQTVVLSISTGKDGWDALNPQFVVYVNGRLIQGLDVNHRMIILSKNAKVGEVFSIALH